MLSKSEKSQLIEIEKCERSAGKQKILDKLQSEKTKMCKPFDDKIEQIRKQRDLLLMKADLFYISEGCGKTNPETEKWNAETNKRIKAILRE